MIDSSSIPGLLVDSVGTTINELASSVATTQALKFIVRAPTATVGAFLDTTLEAKQEYNNTGNLGWAVQYGATKFFVAGATTAALTQVIGLTTVAVVGAPLTVGAAIAIGIGSAVVATAIWDRDDMSDSLRLAMTDFPAFKAAIATNASEMYANGVQVAQGVATTLNNYAYDATKGVYNIYNNAATQAQYYGQQLGKILLYNNILNNGRVHINVWPHYDFPSELARDIYVANLVKDARDGLISASEFRHKFRLATIDGRNQIGEYIITDIDPSTLLQQHKGAKFNNFSNGSDTQTVSSNGQPIAYITKKTTATVTTASGQTVNKFEALKDVALQQNRIADFADKIGDNLLQIYGNGQGAFNTTFLISEFSTRLLAGENIEAVAANIAGRLLLQGSVGAFFDSIKNTNGTVWDLSKTQTEFVKSALLDFATLTLLSNQNTDVALKQIVTSQVVNTALKNKIFEDVFNKQVTNAAGEVVGQLSANGVGVSAAVIRLASALTSGEGINATSIKSAGVAYAQAAVAQQIGTALGREMTLATIFNTPLTFNPATFAAAVALTLITNQLFAKTQYIHGETVGNITQTQADGSLLLIGTRPAGSLLRTTGTTNDDYIGNDSWRMAA